MVKRHLLVTNDFPPKLGGIQSYLWELWRRLPPDSFSVITTDHPQAKSFDAAQPFKIRRLPAKVLLPTAKLASFVRSVAIQEAAEYVILDPALPLGVIGLRLNMKYGVIAHGAEISVPAHLPGINQVMAKVFLKAEFVIAAGGWPAKEVEGIIGGHHDRLIEIPPGVDASRFKPLSKSEVGLARKRMDVPYDAELVVALSRLVPRKGMDVLIEAVASVAKSRPQIMLAIGGSGRDWQRLSRIIDRLNSPARLMGVVAGDLLPSVYGAADIFAMPCRNRWMGLEQEGYGIVFLEAAAAGVPQIAGRSGGAHEAVLHNTTGLVVDRPQDPSEVADALQSLLSDDVLKANMGRCARARVETESDYGLLAKRLEEFLA